jgi:hypothetical protein
VSRPFGRLGVVVAFAAAVFVAGCSNAGASFDPTSPCTADGRFPGAYPELEAAVPRALGGRGPDRLDSGRNCTEKSLATLQAHGVKELRFAGGLWEQGSSSGTTLAIFTSSSPLDADWLAEFYEAGARSGKNTEGIKTGSISVAGASGRRLDTLNDESYQTVITWPRDGDVAAAIIASSVREVGSRDAHEARVRDALAAFGAGPAS